MTKEIQLTRGQVSLVDDEDYERANKYKWHTARSEPNGKPYVKTTKQANNKKKNIRLHRFIISAKDGEEVDHINGDTLDNRRCNLRICTHSQNMANTGAYSTNTSGYKGVSFEKSTAKWRAGIMRGGKHYSLGLHTTPELAAIAYNKAAVQYYGEFAYQNVI